MKYIYTQANCPKCESLKSGLMKQGILFKERSAERLQNGKRVDAIDVDGFIKLQMQGLTLPVEVDAETADDPVDESWDA